ncbi:hypothetical protein CsSME_00008209 [Camellia sinensis var. sinensis]
MLGHVRVLPFQIAYLQDWDSIERDHTSSLSQAIKDLQSSTLRLPVTGGARGSIETVKAAVCSAVDVMQTMGSSVYSILAQALCCLPTKQHANYSMIGLEPAAQLALTSMDA